MIIKNDSRIRAEILGIYISITFDGNNIISFQDINHVLDNRITIHHIKSLVKKHNTTTYQGSIKCLLTITKKNFKKLYNHIQVDTTFNDLIIKCLLDDDLINNITLLICGTNDDIDEYDELYECNICKYFSNFWRLPKMKLQRTLEHEDIKFLFERWSELYFITSIRNLDMGVFIPIEAFAKYHKITLDDITLINNDNKLLIYITINENKILFDTTTLYMFNNNKITTDNILTFNNKIIAFNIIDLLKSKLNFSDIIYINGNFKYVI